jgi:dihydrodipicolinate synthase/N-acetylneuraminate lyase
MRSLTSSDLHGLWAAVPTPFAGGREVDGGVLRFNCQRLAAARVDGIYTTDSDGEFYSIELDEFRHLASLFAKAVEGLRVEAAMGVTWINTQGAIDRVRAALDHGIPNVHVGLPFFMPLPEDDVWRFFDQLAAEAPAARWIYYSHPAFKPEMNAVHLAALQRRHPVNLIGTKIAAHEGYALAETVLHAPGLAHFGGDLNLLAAAILGARGSYSYWVNTMPVWTRRFTDRCLTGDFTGAAAMQKKLLLWETTAIARIRARGHRHGTIGKARCALTGFLHGDGSTRGPYSAVAPEEQAILRRQFDDFWREELEGESLGTNGATP